MEIDNVPSPENLKIRFVILVLVPAAGIGVALVIGVGNFDSIFDGAGKICSKMERLIPWLY